VAVLDAQQLGPHGVETPGLLPQLSWLHDGHAQLHGARAVHFFTHDGFDLADHAQAQRHVVVDTGAQFLDEAGAQHELVAHHFSVGRGFFEGGNEELGGFHRAGFQSMQTCPLAAREAPCIMDTVQKILGFDYA